MADQRKQDLGRQDDKRRVRLLRTVRGPEVVGPVTQRNLGVWLGLTLIVVVVGLDLVGGGNAELLGLLVGPPIQPLDQRSPGWAGRPESTDAISSVVSYTNTDKLHERIYAPYGV
jgi:hypothetical protein